MLFVSKSGRMAARDSGTDNVDDILRPDEVVFDLKRARPFRENPPSKTSRSNDISLFFSTHKMDELSCLLSVLLVLCWRSRS